MPTPQKAPTTAPAPAPAAPASVETPAPVITACDGVRLFASPTIGTLARQLAHAQGQFKVVKKDGENPFFNSSYATLAAIIEMLRQPLADNGLAFVQSLVGTAGGRVMRTIIMHGSGEWLVSEMPCFGSSTKPQDVGSATTYAKRYGLQAAFGIAVADDADDDDGNKANGNTPPSTKPAPPAK